jgi:hypothetical protein
VNQLFSGIGLPASRGRRETDADREGLKCGFDTSAGERSGTAGPIMLVVLSSGRGKLLAIRLRLDSLSRALLV